MYCARWQKLVVDTDLISNDCWWQVTDWLTVVRVPATVRLCSRGSYGLIVNADWLAVVRSVPTVLYCGRGSYGLNVNTD